MEMPEWIIYFSAYFLAGLSLKLGDDLLDLVYSWQFQSGT
jgi:hypothetical protein